MSALDWSAIVARAQEAYRLRRWSRLRADSGDTFAALRLEVRARRAESRMLTIARNCGVPL
jgi:hypothetical protein